MSILSQPSLASPRVIIDAHLVIEVLVQIRIQVRLQNLFEGFELGFFLGFEGARVVQHFAVAVSQDVG